MRNLLITPLLLSLTLAMTACFNEKSNTDVQDTTDTSNSQQDERNTKTNVESILAKNAWNDFEGNLGDFKIRLSLYQSENGKTVDGSYSFMEIENKITLQGKVEGTHIKLDEIFDGRKTGEFEGEIITDDTKDSSDTTPQAIKGTWVSASGDKTLEFSLDNTGTQYTGDLNKRYSSFLEPDHEVENYIYLIKQNLLDNKKEWIANNIQYPMKVTLSKDGAQETVEINTKEDFLAQYPEIITDNFKEHIKNSCVCNMFEKNGAVMLANGRLWIAQDGIVGIYNAE